MPHREYYSTDVQSIAPREIYKVEVEIWPMNVIVSPRGRLVFKIAGADTQGCGIFKHKHPEDRRGEVFATVNVLHFGVGEGNYVTLPFIPKA
jgi:hypothetical protein